MEIILSKLLEVLPQMVTAVVQSLIHNWLPLSLGIVTAVIMKVHVNSEKLKRFLLRKPKISIGASVVFGAFTPLCACGTMAVIIGMLTTTLPWGPIMAFLTSSPLMSPDGFILLAGIIGIKFAVALALASLIIGFSSGFLTDLIERRTDFLKDQTRFSKIKAEACSCSETTQPAAVIPETACGCTCSEQEPALELCCEVQTCCSSLACCDAAAVQTAGTEKLSRFIRKLKLREMADAFVSVGLKQILLYFSVFVGIGYLINAFIPTDIIMSLFSAQSIFSVPLAAFIGLPLYVSGDAAIPLIKTLLDNGAGGGAMLAFMITGPATSAWVIAGISVFMKRRVIGLYIFYILAGGILLGYLYDLLLAMGL